MDTIIYINNLEIALLILSLLVLFFVALKNIKSIKTSLILTVCLIPPLYLSIEGTTQFLTADEKFIIFEIIDIQNSNLRDWNGNANRTSDAVIGTFLSLFKKYTYLGKQMTLNDFKMFAKAIHWLLGFLIIIIIYQLINKFYISESQKSSYFVIYFSSVLLIPSHILALKIINYDLLSMLLGVLALILLLIALKINDNNKYSVISIIISTLATQEKFIASPILLCSFIIFTYLKLNKTKISLKKTFYYSGYSILIALFTSLVTFTTVSLIARGDGIPKLEFSTVSYPLIMFLAPIIRVIKSEGALGGNFLNQSTFIPLTFMLIMVSIISLALIKFNRWTTLLFGCISKNISVTITLLVFLLGITSSFLIKAFWHPLHPIPEGNYFPSLSFPQYILHFGADSLFKHILSYIQFAYAVFINGIPSIYIIILGLLLWKQKNNNEDIFLGWRIILLMALSIPFIYALTSIPVSHRYFNLFIFLVILVISLEFSAILDKVNNLIRLGAIILFINTLILEVIPFRPIFGAFRPIWSNYSEKYSIMPIIGQTNTSWWLGWGDEVFLTGKRLEQMRLQGKINSNNNLHIYYFYNGEWINSHKWVTTYHFYDFGKYEKRELPKDRFTDADYYVVNRSSITQKFPGSFFCENITPFFTLSFRGYIQAWIYRGDQLKYCPNLQSLQE